MAGKTIRHDSKRDRATVKLSTEQLIESTFAALEAEIEQLRAQGPIAPGVWLVFPPGRKPQLRWLSGNRTRSKTIERHEISDYLNRIKVRDEIELKEWKLSKLREIIALESINEYYN